MLVPSQGDAPGRPEDLPVGRAALRLEAEGVRVVFGSRAEEGRLIGHIAEAGHWRPAQAPVLAAYDRYPSQTDPEGHARLLEALGAPTHNPVAPILLCRDKLASQRWLEGCGVPMPELEADPDHFAERLEAWGAGFLKPRYGAFGRGVRRVMPGDALPAWGPGAVPGVDEPLLLQRAVTAPQGWAGISVRVLVQREGDDWLAEQPVARRSETDPVVNAARGAEVVPAEVVADAEVLRAQAVEVARAVERSPDGDGVIELGVDLVVGEDGRAWVVEVNSRPRGRLAALAATDPRWEEAHTEACARPLRWLAQQYGV